MIWQHTPFTIPLLTGAVLAALQAISVWRRRSTAGWRQLTLMLGVVSFWSLTYALEIAAVELPAKLFWARIEYFAIVLVPLAWFAFLLMYSEQGHFLTRPLIGLLLVVPLITLVAVWTNPSHHLYWSNSSLDFSRDFTLVVNEYGPLFWLWIGYAYLVFTASSVVMAYLTLRSPQLAISEIAVLLIGASLPWFSNVVSVTGLNPFPGLDMTPFALLVSATILAGNIFEQRLLDVHPVVREMVYENLRDGILVLDRSDRVVMVNRAVQRILKRDADGLMTHQADALLPQWSALTADLPPEADATLELVLPHQPTPIYLELQLVPLRDRRNRLTGRTVTLRDISERKSNEVHLRYQATLMRHITDAVITVQDGRITGWNQAAEMLYGWRMEEVIGRSIYSVLNMYSSPSVSPSVSLPVSPPVSPPVPNPNVSVAANGYAGGENPSHVDEISSSTADILRLAHQQGHWQGELLQNHRRGMPIYVSSVISTLHDAPMVEEGSGEETTIISGIDAITPVSQLIINRDITQFKQAEMIERETQKLESMSVLADGVAGDFSALLTSVAAQTSLALSALPPDSKASQHIRSVANSAQRAVEITQQLMAYAGKEHGERQALTVNGLIRETMRIFEPRLPGRTSLYTDLTSHPTAVMGDATQLGQVLENLLRNATESIPPTGGRVVVRTFVEEATQDDVYRYRYHDRLHPGTYIGVEISDTGVGMGTAVQERIFDPFYTTKPTGRGLGLSATLGIIRAHGGGLNVRSEPGQGTQFIILLPQAGP